MFSHASSVHRKFWIFYSTRVLNHRDSSKVLVFTPLVSVVLEQLLLYVTRLHYVFSFSNDSFVQTWPAVIINFSAAVFPCVSCTYRRPEIEDNNDFLDAKTFSTDYCRREKPHAGRFPEVAIALSTLSSNPYFPGPYRDPTAPRSTLVSTMTHSIQYYRPVHRCRYVIDTAERIISYDLS